MDDNKFREIRHKLEQAERVKKSIESIDEFFNSIGCQRNLRKIEFNYNGPAKGLPFDMDPVGEGNYTYIETLSAERFGISDREFSEMFFDAVVERLGVLKKEFEQKYKNIEV